MWGWKRISHTTNYKEYVTFWQQPWATILDLNNNNGPILFCNIVWAWPFFNSVNQPLIKKKKSACVVLAVRYLCERGLGRKIRGF